MSLNTFKSHLYFDPEHNVYRLWNQDIDNLLGAGWTGQQIAKYAPQLGIEIGKPPQKRIDDWAGGAVHIDDATGLLGASAAQHYIMRDRTLAEIAGHAIPIGSSPVGRGGGWEGGFTQTGAQMIKHHFANKEKAEAQEAQIRELQQPKIPTAAELMASIPKPKVRAGVDYATTGVRAQGMKIRHGSKFAEGGNRGTRSYFSRKAKYSGTKPTMNIATGSSVGNQANSTLNTA